MDSKHHRLDRAICWLLVLFVVDLNVYAEVIGVEEFYYADGLIADKVGGAFWDLDQTPGGASPHGGSSSDWDNVPASPAATIMDGRLETTNSSVAKREFNGVVEGAIAPSDELDGAFQASGVVYLRVTMTRDANVAGSGVGSYEFGNERLFFGVPSAANPVSGSREFGIELSAPFTGTKAYSGVEPVAGRSYTVVAKIDFDGDQLSLWIDPDFSKDESANTPAVSMDYAGTNWSTAVGLASSGTGTTAWDDLIVATTWAEVGQFSVPHAVFQTIEEGGELTITGYSLDGNSCPEGLLIIPAAIGDKPVTSLGDSAFVYCRFLTTVALPDSLTSVGNGSFYACNGLEAIALPDGLTSIGASTLANTGLTAVTLPDSLSSIGGSAFFGCSSLTEISVGAANTSYQSVDGVLFNKSLSELVTYPRGRDGVYAIPSGVVSVGASAFGGSNSLTGVTLPEGITTIGSSAFYACGGLTEITLPESLVSIGESTFAFCSSLNSISIGDTNSSYQSVAGVLFDKSLTELVVYPGGLVGDYVIPAGVESFGYAFSGCTGLTGITLPEGLAAIGDRAFISCSGLIEVVIPDTVTSIGDLAFYYCSGLTEVRLPESLITIGNSAFLRCSGLTRLDLPGNLTSIGNFAFVDCTRLTEVTLPDGLVSIGRFAFRSCSELKVLILPDSLTSIGDFAFQGSGLRQFYFLGDAPTQGGDIFSGVSDRAQIFRLSGTSGWGAPGMLWGDLPTALWSATGRITAITLSEEAVDLVWSAFGPGTGYAIQSSTDGTSWIDVPTFENLWVDTLGVRIPRSTGSDRLLIRVRSTVN